MPISKSRRKIKKRMGWDTAIADAKKRIEALRGSIAIFRRMKADGEVWPDNGVFVQKQDLLGKRDLLCKAACADELAEVIARNVQPSPEWEKLSPGSIEYLALVCERESAVYLQNSEECRKAGHFVSARNDEVGSLACIRIAKIIRDFKRCPYRLSNGNRCDKPIHEGDTHVYSTPKLYEARPVPPSPTNSFLCAARHSDTGANDPQDCSWPFCGCDQYADKVIEAIKESGFTLMKDEDLLRLTSQAEARPVQQPAQIIAAQQAEDEGLWCIPQTVMEAHLQKELRRLTEAVEGKTSAECLRELLLKSRVQQPDSKLRQAVELFLTRCGTVNATDFALAINDLKGAL